MIYQMMLQVILFGSENICLVVFLFTILSLLQSPGQSGNAAIRLVLTQN